MTLLDATTWTGKVFIDGWEPGGAGDYAVVEPATGEELGRLGLASADDVARAADRASEAQPAWANTMYQERAAILRRAGDLWNEHAEEVQGWIVRETGAIPPKAQLETWFAASSVLRISRAGLAPLRRAAPDTRPRAQLVSEAPARSRGCDLPVQLPVDPVDPGGRSGACARQRRPTQAGSPHRGFRRVTLARIFAGGRIAGRAPQRAAGGRRRGEALVTDRATSDGFVHRIHARGASGGGARGATSQEGPSGARGEFGADRARRRGCREGSVGRCLRVVHAPGPDLHDDGPPSRTARHRR